MKSKCKDAVTGAAVAVAAAALVSCASVAGMGGTGGASSSSGKSDLVHCYGVNVCKGHNDCKTATHACAGRASCNGSGFVAMPSKACKDIGGILKDSWKGAISQADLTKCYDVNVCKGHNDCKTASNACAGHASCKGSGWVSMPAKACGDVGGSTQS